MRQMRPIRAGRSRQSSVFSFQLSADSFQPSDLPSALGLQLSVVGCQSQDLSRQLVFSFESESGRLKTGNWVLGSDF